MRAFQYAWPPLAYSVRDDAEAARVYGLVTTYYLLLSGWVVAALALLGRWVLRLLAAPRFYPAHGALTWVALGWALYGLWVVFLVIAGRAKVTTRNFPASLVGLAVNVGLLFALVPGLGITGAGIALCGAYVAMLTVMHLLTRRVFAVDFEWARILHLSAVYAAVAVAGELLAPTHGAVGLVIRVALVAAMPAMRGRHRLSPRPGARRPAQWDRAHPPPGRAGASGMPGTPDAPVARGRPSYRAPGRAGGAGTR